MTPPISPIPSRRSDSPNKINGLLGLGEPFTAIGCHQHFILLAHVATFCHHTQFEGIDTVLFNFVIWHFAITRPARPKHGATIVRVSANAMTKRVLVFLVASLDQVCASSLVNLPTGDTRSQHSFPGLNRAFHGSKGALHSFWRLLLSRL